MPFKNPPKLYACWQAMKHRCYNKKHPSYNHYGGRGITVCDEWIHDFSAFERSIGERPKGMTLDRIDNDKGYNPDNCKWSTKKEQQRNQQVTRKITINGVEHIAADLADIAGIKTDTIVSRFNRGLPVNKILSKDKLLNLTGLSFGGKANGKQQRAKTHCKHGHEFSSENTYFHNGYRSCRKCSAIREQNRRDRLKSQ